MRSGAGCGLDRMMEIARDANQSFKEPLMAADHGPDHLRWFWSFTLHGPMTRPFGNDALQTELAGVGTLRLPAGLWNPPRANPLIGDNQRRGRLCRVSSFTS